MSQITREILRASIAQGVQYDLSPEGEVYRQCNRCGQYRLFTPKHFTVKRSQGLGLIGPCRICRNAYQREWSRKRRSPD